MRYLAALVFIGMVLAVSGCVSQDVIDLKGVEVSDFEGKKLSPIGDIRDVSIAGPQTIDIGTYSLSVTGLVKNPTEMTYDEVLSRQRYRKVVDLNCVLGWSSTNLWEGVLVRDVIQKASPLPGANTVIFKAVDGYSTSFPLEYITDNDIIMAYKVNNVTLTPSLGYPFSLVAEEKWGYKWIKWITEIELSDDPEYRGYWETRGYSNDGGTDKDYFE